LASTSLTRPVEELTLEDYRGFIERTAQRMLKRLKDALPTPQST